MQDKSSVTPADAEEYTESLKQVWAGGWRQVLLAHRMGIPTALGMSTSEWVDSLGGYVKMSIPERREAARELIEEEGMSTRQAAEVLGVDNATVWRDMNPVADATPEPPLQVPEAPVPVADATPEPPRLLPEPETPLDIEDIDDDGSVAKAKLKATFRDRLYQSGRLVELNPEAIAAVLDEDDADALLRHVRAMSEWVAQFEEIRPKGLRVVGGRK